MISCRLSWLHSCPCGFTDKREDSSFRSPGCLSRNFPPEFGFIPLGCADYGVFDEKHLLPSFFLLTLDMGLLSVFKYLGIISLWIFPDPNLNSNNNVLGSYLRVCLRHSLHLGAQGPPGTGNHAQASHEQSKHTSLWTISPAPSPVFSLKSSHSQKRPPLEVGAHCVFMLSPSLQGEVVCAREKCITT